MPRVDNELRGGMWSVKLEDMQSRAWRMCGTVVAGFGAAGAEEELDDAGAVGAAAADICIRVEVGRRRRHGRGVVRRSPTRPSELYFLLLSHSELTVLEGSSGSDDGPVVSVVPEVI